MRLGLTITCLALFATGCTSANKVETHEDYATEWKHLSLFELENRVAYATNASAAGELCELSAEVAREFERITGEPAEPLVLVARDEDDPLLYDSLADELKLLFSENAVVFEQEIDPEEQIRQFLQQLENDRIDVMVGLSVRPFVVRASSFFEGEPTAASARYVAIVPTEDRLEAAIDELVESGFRRKKVGWGQRLLLLPALPFMKSKIHDSMYGLCKITLFSLHTQTREWDLETKQKHIGVYLEELGIMEE